MRVTLGQTIVVENMGGAGGTLVDHPRGPLGARRLHARHGHARPVRDFGRGLFAAVRHAARISRRSRCCRTFRTGWSARKGLPPTICKELIAWLKANPDKASASSVGTASMARFCGMAISERAPARASSSCPIAAARRRCKIWWRDRSTCRAISRRIRLPQYRAATSRPMR